MLNRKRSLSILLALFIFLAQFASVVHATDHPFHQDDLACVSFQNAEHNKLLHVDSLSNSIDLLYVATTSLTVSTPHIPSFDQFYLQRAPPSYI